MTTSFGARIVCGFSGTHAADAGVEAVCRRIEAGESAGVVLFSYNIQSPAQLAALTQHLHRVSRPASAAPLLVMVDQEGGRVQRLTADKGFVATPSAKKLSMLDEHEMRAHVKAMAAQLHSLHINVNLAPCCDVMTNGESVIGQAERSFGDNPHIVARCARMFIEEHARVGIATTLKHYPGLGSARGDTHAGLIDATADWQQQETVPFAQLARVDPLVTLMSTHMVNRQLEPSGLPMTFSRKAMRASLRDDMSKAIVCMTDDLDMGAMRRHYSFEEVVERALLAGHDILMFGENEAALGDGRAPRHVPIAQLAERVSEIAERMVQVPSTRVMFDESARRLASWGEALRAAARR